MYVLPEKICYKKYMILLQECSCVSDWIISVSIIYHTHTHTHTHIYIYCLLYTSDAADD